MELTVHDGVLEVEDVAGSDELAWAEASVERAIQTGFVVGIALWQVVLVGAVLVTPDREIAADPLVLLHAGFTLFLVVLVFRRWSAHLIFAPMLIVIAVDVIAAPGLASVLLFAAVWMWNFAHATPPFLFSGWRAWVAGAVEAFGLPLVLALAHPDWGLPLAGSAVVTSLAMQGAVRLALPRVRAFARSADATTVAAAAEREALVAAEGQSWDAAETARIVHDTVINTFSAVADGGVAVRDPDQLRDKVERDIAALEAIEEGDLGRLREGPGALAAEPTMRDFVVRTGLDDDRVRAWTSDLSDEEVTALHGIVREAVQNSQKHSGASQVVVDVAIREDGLQVLVRDDGVGFDGTIPDGRGLARSVLGRARQAGFSAELLTRPGRGTELLITVPHGVRADVAEQDSGERDFLTLVEVTRRRAAWAWSFGTCGVGVIIELFNHPGQLTSAYAMVAVLLAATVIARHALGERARLPDWTVVLLVASAPLAFVLSAGAVDYGRSDPTLWQAFGATPPVVLLITFARTPTAALIAQLLVIVAATHEASHLVGESPDAASIMIVGALPSLGLALGWYAFHHAIHRVGARAAADQKAARRARLETARRRASDLATARWRTAGLRDSIALLGRLAAGSADPRDASVREECAREESYLRNLIQLSPDVVHLGRWFTQSLAVARSGGVELVVRTSSTDASDAREASRLGALLLSVVTAAASGARLTLTLIQTEDATRLSIVGRDPALVHAVSGWSPPEGWVVVHHVFGEEFIVEVVRSGAAIGGGES